MTAVFRTCAQTGLKVHAQAETLIKANAVAGIFAILFGGIAALLVLLTRWPAVHLLGPAGYYRALTFHGINMLIFWIIFFEIAILYFASAVVLNSRLAWPKVGWVAFGLMVVGAVTVDVAILRGVADVMMTSYVPLRAVWYFYLGIILFAVGALAGVCNFFATLFVAKAEKTYEGSVPLVTFGAAAAAIIAVVALAHGAVIYIPTFLWSIGLIPNIDPAMYRLIWWGLGHNSQQINVAAMISVWYLLGTLTVGAIPISEKVCRTAFLLYILFINLAAAHHLLVDPALSSSWKVWNTSYAMYMAVMASMIHGMTVPASLEVAQRRKGLSKGLFEWLTKAPWGNPSFGALILSIVLFGFIGGITGVTYGTEQINIIAHNTMRIPGHFHGTVVAGTTLAFMGLTYYVVPLIFRRQLVSKTLATLQVYSFGIGTAILAISMTLSGSYGVPRRHWDVTFATAAFKPSFEAPAYVFLGLMALGGLLAIVGGALYVLVTVGSVLFGPRVPDRPGMVEIAAVPKDTGKHIPVPGTLVLVFVFLAAFVIYYFLNWKWLSNVWLLK